MAWHYPLEDSMADETTAMHPVVRALEQEAINLYRAKHPDGPPWQELHADTRHMLVAHAEQQRTLGVATPEGSRNG
jgi:hypothetical protein